MTQAIKVGDTFFVYDDNRRVYLTPNRGPDFRSKFVPVTVEGETSRSWVIGPSWRNMKVPKSSPFPPLYTQAMIDEAVWDNDYRHKIISAIGRSTTTAQLRQIAEIIGWQEPPPASE